MSIICVEIGIGCYIPCTLRDIFMLDIVPVTLMIYGNENMGIFSENRHISYPKLNHGIWGFVLSPYFTKIKPNN